MDEKALKLRDEHLETERVIDCLGLLAVIGSAIWLVPAVLLVETDPLPAMAALAGGVVTIMGGSLTRRFDPIGRSILSMLAVAWGVLAAVLFPAAMKFEATGVAGAVAVLWILWRKESTFVFSPEYQAIIEKTSEVVRPKNTAVVAAVTLGPPAAFVAYGYFLQLVGAFD